MKNSIAKNVTRQVVINLFNDYAKSLRYMFDNCALRYEGDDKFFISSLPGRSFEFEIAAANICAVHNLKNFEMTCYEKNHDIYNDSNFLKEAGFVAYSNKRAKVEALRNTCRFFYYTDDINDWSKDDVIDELPNFFWLDYCGCPKNGNMNFLKHVNYAELCSSVYVFTYEIAMRQGCDPEIQKHIDSGMSKAEAVIQYVKDTIKDTDFEVLFKIEYVSNRAPMILIAISNVKELKDNKYDYSHLEKTKKVVKQKQIKVTNDKSLYNTITIGTSADLIRAHLKAGHADDVIMSKHNIGKRTLSAHKAWITMGK